VPMPTVSLAGELSGFCSSWFGRILWRVRRPKHSQPVWDAGGSLRLDAERLAGRLDADGGRLVGPDGSTLARRAPLG
jgi:hypothetical protein